MGARGSSVAQCQPFPWELITFRFLYLKLTMLRCVWVHLALCPPSPGSGGPRSRDPQENRRKRHSALSKLKIYSFLCFSAEKTRSLKKEKKKVAGGV